MTFQEIAKEILDLDKQQYCNYNDVISCFFKTINFLQSESLKRNIDLNKEDLAHNHLCIVLAGQIARLSHLGDKVLHKEAFLGGKELAKGGIVSSNKLDLS